MARLRLGDAVGDHFRCSVARPSKKHPPGHYNGGYYPEGWRQPAWYEAAADTPDGTQVVQGGDSPRALRAAVEAYEADQGARKDGGVFGRKPRNASIKAVGGTDLVVPESGAVTPEKPNDRQFGNQHRVFVRGQQT